MNNKANTPSPSNTSPFEQPRNRTVYERQVSVTTDRLSHLAESERYERWVQRRTKSVGGVSTQGQVGVNSKQAVSVHTNDVYAKANYNPSELTLSQRQALASEEASRHAMPADDVVGGMQLHKIGVDTSDRRSAQKPVDSRVDDYPALVADGRIQSFQTPNLQQPEAPGVTEGVTVDARPFVDKDPARANAARRELAEITGSSGVATVESEAQPIAREENNTNLSDLNLGYEPVNEPSAGGGLV